MRKYLILITFLMASCGCADHSQMPQWRWGEKEKPDIEPEETGWPLPASLGWTDVSQEFLGSAQGLIHVYKSPETINGVKTVAYLAVGSIVQVDWDVAAIDDPALRGTQDELKTPAEWYRQTAAPIVLNGGYFFAEGGKRYNASVAVSGGRTYGVNINYASLDWETMYYPTRGVFYQQQTYAASPSEAFPKAGWTYWTGGQKHYLYSVPAANDWSADPLPVPDAHFPGEAADFAPVTAIGGGPVLIHGGKIVNTWKEELLYGDGADDKMPEARHPRTAIGVTGEGMLLLFVCEGRGMTEGVAGMTFAEEAAVLQQFGCTEALNLDGGGSSCLLVNGRETIQPSDGAQRPVASVVTMKVKP